MSLSNYNPGQELASIDFSGLIGGPLGAIVDAQSKAALSTVDFVKSIGFTPDSEDETTGEITPGEPIYVKFKYPKMVQPYQPKVEGLLKTLGGAKVGTANVSNADSIVSVSISGGSGGQVTATVNAGAIDLTIAEKGEGYTTADTVTIVYMPTGTNPTQTTAVAQITAVDDIDAVPAVFEEMKLEVPILTMMPIPFIRVDEGEIDFNAKITSMEYARVADEFKLGVSNTIQNTNTNTNIIDFKFFKNKNKNTNTVKLKTNISYQRNTSRGHKIDKTFHMGVKVRVTQEEMPEGMERLLGILEDAIVSQPVE